jgi:hypothetical protein
MYDHTEQKIFRDANLAIEYVNSLIIDDTFTIHIYKYYFMNNKLYMEDHIPGIYSNINGLIIPNDQIIYLKDKSINFLKEHIPYNTYMNHVTHNKKNTYFHLACKNNFQLDTLIFYINNGVDMYIRDQKGKCPLEYLNNKRQKELYNYLINKLKDVIRPAQLNEFLRKYVIYNPKSCYIKRLVSNF